MDNKLSKWGEEKNKYIMVMDNSPSIRSLAEFVLTSLRYPVIQAEDGEDGLNKIKDIRTKGDDIAMCLADINMPVMDGIEFIKEFRKSDKETPVVFLSSKNGMTRMKEEDVKLDVSGCLKKPFHFNELVGVVKNILR
jgi:two-component system chemotaxis response regulator CheY